MLQILSTVKMGNLDQGGVRSTTNWIMLFCVYFRFHWTYSKYFFFNIQFRIFSVYLKKKYKFGLTSLELNWPPQTWSTLPILKFRKHPPPNKKLATWIFFFTLHSLSKFGIWWYKLFWNIWEIYNAVRLSGRTYPLF